MRKHLFLFPVFFLFVSCCLAQEKLYFINRQLNKVIEVKEGDYLAVSYNGYLGQREFAKSIVTEISDSFIVLGSPNEMFRSADREPNGKVTYKKILISDLRGFRRMSAARQITKNVISLGSVVGSYFLLTDLYGRNNVSNGNAFLISLGTGIGINILINLVFPEHVKYRISDGWQVGVAAKAPDH